MTISWQTCNKIFADKTIKKTCELVNKMWLKQPFSSED